MDPVRPESRSPLTVLLVDQQALLREALAAVLEREGHLVVGQSADAEAALALVRTLEPSVVILDLDLPDGSALSFCRYVRRRHPRTRVIALSGQASGRVIFQGIVAGIDGYRPKTYPLSRLLRDLEELAAGRSLLYPGARGIAKRFLQHTEAGAGSGDGALSPREREIVTLVSRGKTNREIAATLYLSHHTVRHYLENIMDRAGVHTRAALVAKVRAEESHAHAGG